MSKRPTQPSSTRYIQASELNSFDYCERAWWYQHYRRFPNQNQRALDAGSRFHRQHGRATVWARRMRWVAAGCLVVGLILLLLYWYPF